MELLLLPGPGRQGVAPVAAAAGREGLQAAPLAEALAAEATGRVGRPAAVPAVSAGLHQVAHPAAALEVGAAAAAGVAAAAAAREAGRRRNLLPTAPLPPPLPAARRRQAGGHLGVSGERIMLQSAQGQRGPLRSTGSAHLLLLFGVSLVLLGLHLRLKQLRLEPLELVIEVAHPAAAWMGGLCVLLHSPWS